MHFDGEVREKCFFYHEFVVGKRAAVARWGIRLSDGQAKKDTDAIEGWPSANRY